MKKALTYVVLLLLGVGASAQSHHEVDTSAATYDTVEYHAPKKNPILYFGSPFCEHFAEVRLLFGQEDAGVGLMYSYVPEVWGFNFSGAVSFENLWLSAGARRCALPRRTFPRLGSNFGGWRAHVGPHRLRPFLLLQWDAGCDDRFQWSLSHSGIQRNPFHLLFILIVTLNTLILSTRCM